MMKNEIVINEINSVGTRRLRLPLQTAPVERTLAAAPQLAGQEGVVPSFDFTSLIPIATTLLSMI